jgi:anti-sigma factor ChrR (cupin superfamily)
MVGKHYQPDDEVREWASLYALGVLPPDERESYEEHLRAGCTVCLTEVADFERVTGSLGFAAAPAQPSADLRSRLLARITEARKPGVLYEDNGLLLTRSGEIPWRPADVAGVETRLLFFDPSKDYVTVLVRMQPGTVYPRHRHPALEELYVLEGDVQVGEIIMRPGDYCRAEAGTIHPELRTVTGCQFFMTASPHNQLL